MNISTFSHKFILSTALIFFSLIGSSNASMITFSDFIHNGDDVIDYEVTIDDSLAGEFKVTYNVTSGNVGKLTGIYFDFGAINTATLPDPDLSEPYTAANIGLNSEVNPSSSSICGMAFGDINAVSGPNGCNSTLQYGGLTDGGIDYSGFLFDVGLAWKTNDLTPPDTSGSFVISDLGLTLADWTAVGLRGQATGTDGEGSAKEFSLVKCMDDDCGGGGGNNDIPEPQTLLIFATGLLGLIVSRKKLTK